MAVHTWCLLASVFLASVGAEIYDQGPQTFYESSSPISQSEKGANKEFVLYLTRSQARALATNGALVKPQLDTETESDYSERPQVVEEQREPLYENNQNEEEKKDELDSELEEIFKILNQQKVNEEERREEKQAAEKPRKIPAQFKPSKLQQEDKKYYASPAAKNLGPAKSYSYVRFLHPSEDIENQTVKFYRGNPLLYYQKPQDSGEQKEENRTEEDLESENQEDQISSFRQHQKITARIIEHRDRLLKTELELQNKLRELQDAPKHNNQKYAIEIEKLRSNLEKQNALSKVEAIAKSAPILVKEEITVKPRRPVEFVKYVKEPALNPVIVRVPQPFEEEVPQPYTVPAEIVRPVPVPLVKAEKVEVQSPTPVDLEKRVPVTAHNVYVKVNKPYLVERIVPTKANRQIPVDPPLHKPEKLTILRHIWEH